MWNPATGVLVANVNSHAADSAADLPSVPGAAYLNPGDIIWCTTPVAGSPMFWQVLTGGLSPTYSNGPNASANITTTVALTSVNILAMEATPVLILAAPGSGLGYIVSRVEFVMTTTSTQYAAGGAVDFVYHGGSVNAAGGTIPAAIVTAAAGTSYTFLGPATSATVPVNTGIDITNATAAFTTGTGTAVVKITYSIVPLP